ncbi:MAG: PDZ domain-containing protein [Bacteroidales bacterium]|nr:PDZ domain-containing protein [Bacteroidales bacterium]
MKAFKLLSILGILIIFVPAKISAIDTKDTRLLQQPAISDQHIAFIYAHDLWVANADGTNPRRLTVDEGVEGRPNFSPDGKMIAFSAEYDGNTDVFIVPVEGGIPTRLTWHPGQDIVSGFTPDGKSVLFLSQRNVFTNRYLQLFTIPLEGGMPEQLEIPNAYHACFSPDGTQIAYTPLSDAFTQWKNYRGGRTSKIWLFSFNDHSVVEIPRPEGESNDITPMWIGDKVYFLSDRNGEFNLYSYDTKSGKIDQHTEFTDFPVVNASFNNNTIILEQAGYLQTYDTRTDELTKITVGIAADLLELRTRFVKGNRYIRAAHVSPSGERAVFGFRGEIITAPADKGDPRNITQTFGTHEQYPAWSPDGSQIAYLSDASGEYKLHLKAQDGSGEEQAFDLEGTGFYAHLEWSPDSRKICYVDNGRNFYYIDINNGNITKIDQDELYQPGAYRELFGDWSSDSKWITYTKLIMNNFQQVFLYSIDEGRSYPVTDGLSHATEPVFDRGGKYLYFFASTDAGPLVNWFDMSNADMEMTQNIYLVTLAKETESPLAKESDEVEIKDKKGENDSDETREDDDKGKKKKKSKKDKDDNEEKDNAEEKEKLVVIEPDGMQNRILDVPVEAGSYYGLGSSGEGELLYISNDNGKRTMHKYSLKDRKDEEVAEIDNYSISADGKKMLYIKNGTYGIADAGAKPAPDKGVINTGAIEVKIDPLQEWPQIFDEAWRVNRDYFYDPNMHGADWPAMKEKYAQFLPDLACRSDLNRVIQWMCSELAVGHHRVGGGESLNNPERVPGGLLGIDFEVAEGHYRITKIYEGLNWNPNLKSPLTEPGLNVKTGDFILGVNGEKVTAKENFYRFFENTAGKIVSLEIGPNTDGSGSREIKAVPVSSEYALRNRDWVEGNLKKVDEATGGQVAYVYVPNTAGLGHEYFKRYFFPQANKKAIIIDERFNGGGALADYYIDILTRRYQSHWNTRYTNDLKTPSASIQGPKVMLIDETAGSGGDMLPWMFRKFDVGTLVGKRTWGGLVGILGFPELMDGGYVTAPNVAIWTEDGFVVENVGVPPDVEVEQWPAEVIKGHDPQLEKAIEIVMEQLSTDPPEEPVRPPYPVRVWQ